MLIHCGLAIQTLSIPSNGKCHCIRFCQPERLCLTSCSIEDSLKKLKRHNIISRQRSLQEKHLAYNSTKTSEHFPATAVGMASWLQTQTIKAGLELSTESCYKQCQVFCTSILLYRVRLFANFLNSLPRGTRYEVKALFAAKCQLTGIGVFPPLTSRAARFHPMFLPN